MQKEEALKAAALKMTESCEIHQRYVTVLRTVCRCHVGKTDDDPHNRKVVFTPRSSSWKWKNTNILNAPEIKCLSALCLFKNQTPSIHNAQMIFAAPAIYDSFQDPHFTQVEVFFYCFV